MKFTDYFRATKRSTFLIIIAASIGCLLILTCSKSPTEDTLIETYPPSVEITSPANNSEYTPGDTIRFTASVSDSESNPTDLDIVWRSSLDNTLNTSSANSSGAVSFSSTSLTRGVHTIIITVTDEDGDSLSDTVSIVNALPHSITLNEPVKSIGTVSLTWSHENDNYFDSYQLYRSDSTGTGLQGLLIAEITEADDTTYLDSLPPLYEKAYYKVYIINSDSYYKSSIERQVTEPGGKIINFLPYDAILHPDEPWIYILGQNYDASDTLVVVDYLDMEVVSSTSIGGDVGYMDIGDNGSGYELYLPMKSEGWIKIYDDQTLSNIDNINTGDYCSSVIIDGRGHIFAAVSPSIWWDYPIRSYDRSTGLIIDSTGDSGSFSGSRIRMLPGALEIIEISIGVSPVDMDYYSINSDGYFLNHNDDDYHGDHPLYHEIFRISSDGAYLVTSSEGAVYTADSNMTYLGQLPRGDIEFSDFAFNSNSNTIYGSSDDSTIIKMYTYPGLAAESQIHTRGYSYMLFRAADTLLVSLSRPDINSNKVGIDLIKVE